MYLAAIALRLGMYLLALAAWNLMFSGLSFCQGLGVATPCFATSCQQAAQFDGLQGHTIPIGTGVWSTFADLCGYIWPLAQKLGKNCVAALALRLTRFLRERGGGG